jgi:hypothetical protein
MTTPLQSAGWYPDPSGTPDPVVALHPKNDPLYSYAGSASLASIAPGTVLKICGIPYHILGVPTSLKTTQLLYRSTSQTGNPTVNVTSVIQPLSQRDKTKVISYQSAYDSLNRRDEASVTPTAGGVAQLVMSWPLPASPRWRGAHTSPGRVAGRPASSATKIGFLPPAA